MAMAEQVDYSSLEFVEFMLGMTRDALQEISKAQNEHNVVINVAKNVVTNEDKVISLLRQDNSLSAKMLANPSCQKSPKGAFS